MKSRIPAALMRLVSTLLSLVRDVNTSPLSLVRNTPATATQVCGVRFLDHLFLVWRCRSWTKARHVLRRWGQFMFGILRSRNEIIDELECSGFSSDCVSGKQFHGSLSASAHHPQLITTVNDSDASSPNRMLLAACGFACLKSPKSTFDESICQAHSCSCGKYLTLWISRFTFLLSGWHGR